jgi:cell fate regulator YaaT (PSP1 superfamily)
MNIVGIRFKRFSKTYYFDPAGVELALNDMAIVETARGLELGQVVVAPKDLPEDQVPEPLKPVIRKAEANDTIKAKELESREKEAIIEGAKLVSKLNLPMKLISADYNLDGNRVTIYFSAEERVDFRELVREMAGRLRTRVELRQIGPRDEAKLIGGYGRCGRQLCCRSFLDELAPVSMRMAKDQGLPLNPMKISGCCGRLMCCLGYECQQYRDMRKELPRENSRVLTASGAGKVVSVNPLRGTATVFLDESQASVDLPGSELTPEKPREPERQPEKAPAPEPEIQPEKPDQAPG